jgi:hypothetical protein
MVLGSLLVGSPQPVGWSDDDVRAALADPAVVGWLARGGMDAGDGSGFSRGVEWHERLAPDPARLNTDLFPRDEFYLNEAAY